jgi:hypothetical protein
LIKLKNIIDSFRRKNPSMNKKNLKDESVMPWNIYDDGMKYNDHIKKFNKIHFVFKYKFFIPLLLLGKKLLGKSISKTVPDEPYNKELKIFNDSWDASVPLWQYYYYQSLRPKDKKFPLEHFQKLYSEDERNPLKIIKEFAITIGLNDTAYREFMAIFMHTLVNNLVTEFKEKGCNHLFYTNPDVYYVNYLVITKMLETKTTIEINNLTMSKKKDDEKKQEQMGEQKNETETKNIEQDRTQKS